MVGIITDAYRKTISMYFPSPSSYLHWLLGNSEALNSSSPKRKDFANKGPHSQSYGFSTSHVRVGHKEGWASKNWCFWTVGLGNTLESPLDSKEIKQISPKGNQPWIFIGRTDAETGAPIFWPPDAKNQLTGKDPDAGKDWGQEGKGVTEDDLVGQHHHQLSGHEFEQTLGDSEGQGSLACFSPLGRKQSDMTLATEQ